MAQKLSNKEFWKLYRQLPEELKEAISSEETADYLYEICERHDILENLVAIVEYVGNVLMGLLPPDQFQTTLKTDLNIGKDTAKSVTREINRFIFFPVKSSLEQLHSTEIEPPAQMKVTPPVQAKDIPSAQDQEKPPAPPAKKDAYRESIK